MEPATSLALADALPTAELQTRASLQALSEREALRKLCCGDAPASVTLEGLGCRRNTDEWIEYIEGLCGEERGSARAKLNALLRPRQCILEDLDVTPIT